MLFPLSPLLANRTGGGWGGADAVYEHTLPPYLFPVKGSFSAGPLPFIAVCCGLS